MAWQLTDSPDEFSRAAAAHLQAEPVRQTVALSVLASLREAGLTRFGNSPPLFGWHRRSDGTVDGSFESSVATCSLSSAVASGFHLNRTV